MIIQRIFDYVLPFSVFSVVLLSAYALKKILFSRLSKLAKKTNNDIDDIVIEALKGPFMIWAAMLGIYLALALSTLPENVINIAGKILLIMGIASFTMVLANLTGRVIKVYARQIETTFPVTSLTQSISTIIIFGIGFLIVLNSLGISITPILATLGVGGLAVALALQDTLSNLFSGFHVIVAKQVRVGDYIKLESGEEGYVADINWRTTKIMMLPNNIVLVPNAKLAGAIITNYYLPEKEMAVLINVGVHYDSDLKKVEQVTCEVAKEIMKKVTGGVPEFEPFIRYHTFADFSINFTVILRAKKYVDQYLIKHEFVKQLHERYKKEGIVIPYPIRTIQNG
ncbi:MAG: mechanosensitive ion channel family protein [Candidatus Omnitrophica bacterium]|nr:mechanosensitive ion channel family protein [Candidatus Omnitrophota bacterium]